MQQVKASYLLNLISVEERDAVDNDPRQRAAKVDDLVHDKGHDARCKDIVLHVRVPSLEASQTRRRVREGREETYSPEALKDAQRNPIVLVDLVELVPVGVGRVVRDRGGVPAQDVS